MPSNRAIAPTIAGVVLVVVLLASSAGFAGTPSNSSATGAPVHALESPCPGAPLPHNYSGVLEINGVAPVSPLALEYSYDAVVTTNLTDGVVLSSVCSAENGTVTPASGGSFVLSIDAAANVTCTIPGGGKAGECVSTSGPVRGAERHSGPDAAARLRSLGDPERNELHGRRLLRPRPREPPPGRTGRRRSVPARGMTFARCP